jgi:site-specific DNA-methyltransferase (adenine-specific)
VIFDEVTAGLLDEQSGVGKSSSGKKQTPTKGSYSIGDYSGTENIVGFDDTGGASRFFYVAKASRRDRNEGLEELEAKSAGEMVDRVEGSAGMDSPRAGAGRTAGAKNFHPTVKPTALMRYLIKLVTPPGGTVLDPFTGSGSTGKAALLDGFQFVGIELTEEYLPIIEGRLKWANEKVDDDDTLF